MASERPVQEAEVEVGEPAEKHGQATRAWVRCPVCSRFHPAGDDSPSYHNRADHLGRRRRGGRTNG
jgi:hypothetical protein